MVVFPAVSALISLICAGVIARDAWSRPRPDKIAWAIAFAIFTVAAGIEVVGSLTDWTPALARIYYLTGAVLVVWYLALGELYLLAAPKISKFAPGVTLLVTAISATIVMNAKVDETRLATDGWEAIERGTALTLLAMSINILGTVVIAGGLIYSAVRFKRLGIQRNRMIGCLLIAIGTTIVGMGGTLTRFGHREYLYIAMAAGVAIIFAGYLQARRPDSAKADRKDVNPERAVALKPASAPNGTSSNGRGEANGHKPTPLRDPGIVAIEERLSTGDAITISRFCAEWSAPESLAVAMIRDDARRAWALRQQLSETGQRAFDALPVPVRLQLTELYHDVFASQTIVVRR